MEGKFGRAGEVRRLHIIYFLTHLGRSEHPHLIRVHHLTRTGVYLRDVKRWLGELRGKDMPETYAWSYKRRYKSGYVWQDLLDDDLITPLSDNEYVLKGSEIISTTMIDEKTDINLPGSYSCPENNKAHVKSTSTNGVDQDEKALDKEASRTKPCPDPKIDHLPMTKTFSEINEESSSTSFASDRSTVTDDFDSVKLENDNNFDTKEQHKKLPDPAEKTEIAPPLYCNLQTLTDNKSKNKNSKKNKKSEECCEMGGTPGSPSSSSSKSPLPPKRKSLSGGASNVLRSFITCRAVDTNDTVLVVLNRSGRSGQRSASDKPSTKPENGHSKAHDHEVFNGGHMGRTFRTCWNHPDEDVQQPQKQSTARRSFDESRGSTKKRQQSEFSKQRAIPAAYRPVREPTCSQCGKAFKPEKMHSHMKSCRGLKALANKSNFSSVSSAASVEKSTLYGSSTTSSCNESALGHFLTN
ncbi:hypothetical protein PanWU01x14_228830 [Parasponia andersonii]|uniref:SOSEKI DIX-like domain-containing protein n=1 Tax=Parasponia andersonii TaxID=3476 RepID=A0A2P5BLL7_PARAD|nr:hypothetical protein PanWU01x14_228830 [Parasponia andersonii]